MKFKHFKKLSYFLLAVILTLGLSISFQSLLAAYTSPLNNPPTCVSGNPGCDAPINSSYSAQSTSGSLWITNSSNPLYGLIVENGPVGIGTNASNLTSLTAKLQVTAPESTEGIRIISASNYSPFNIRNSSNNTDIFRVDQTGTLAVGTIPWARLAYFPGACSSGQYVTAVGSSLTCATPTTSGGDATTIDTLDSSQFLRSDADDSMTGALTVTGKITSNTDVCVANGACLNSLGMGTGNINYLAKWTLNGKLGESIIFEDTSSRIGIGTSNLAAKLSIEGSEIAGGTFTGTTAGILRVSGGAYNVDDLVALDFGLNNQAGGTAALARIGAVLTGGGSYLRFGTSNNYVAGITNNTMVIDPSGYVGINTGTSALSYNLTVNGTVAANVFTYTSDGKLKKNIRTLDNALEKVIQLRGVNFNWKSDKENEEQIGLVAQEVEQVYPELVRTAGGLKSVDYGNLVAPLIEAIKQQQKQIDELREQLNKLK